MNTTERRSCDDLTERVLGAVFEVSNTLGAGFHGFQFTEPILEPPFAG